MFRAASVDQGHLELQCFAWLDLSDPLMTHKIVLSWHDIPTHWRPEQSSGSHWTCEQATGDCTFQLTSPPGPVDSQNWKTKAFPEVSFKRPLIFIRTVTLFLFVFASEAQPLGTGLNYQDALITTVVLGFSWTNTRAESKICPTQSWYPRHSEDTSQT